MLLRLLYPEVLPGCHLLAAALISNPPDGSWSSVDCTVHGCTKLRLCCTEASCTGCRQQEQPSHLLKGLWVWLAEVTHKVGTQDAIKLILQARQTQVQRWHP